ncbi:MAG: energy-coupling factor transporter ATPase [Clostridia bacterium]|nr:energy-coupling factor transporter ATPase [Clostridia bacterium]
MPIKIERLSHTYNPKTPFAKTALSDITLEINDGDFLGVVGHTGSGKSTLISHLNALTKIQSGTLIVDGMDLSAKKLDYKKLRSTVGMVFQYPEYQLFESTVEDDVAFGPKNLGLDKDEIARRVKKAIELVGLKYDEVKSRSPFDLSGGQMRRVAIAGVIAMEPDILVLDEPTAGLDPKGKREILALIREIKKSCSIVIMISHDMNEVAQNCNRIALLGEGKLIGVYSPRELFGQKELLKKHKIEMPTTTAIACALHGAGLDIDESVIDEDELVAQIVRAYNGGAR